MDLEEKLIEEVRQKECLYIKSLESYKDPMLKKQAWQEISWILGVPGAACKRRWASLMYTYKRNKQRLRPGIAKPVKIRWKYFKQLAELDNLDSARAVPSNINVRADVLAADISPLPQVSEGDSVIEEQYNTFVDGVSYSMEVLNFVLEENRQQRRPSTAQFLIDLANRIDHSGLYEDEVTELEMETANFIFSEIMEIKKKRV